MGVFADSWVAVEGQCGGYREHAQKRLQSGKSMNCKQGALLGIIIGHFLLISSAFWN